MCRISLAKDILTKDEVIRTHSEELVPGSVEDALNRLLNDEADQL